MTMILVTGASGVFGTAVANELKAQQTAFKTAALETGFNWEQPETFAAALEGATTAFVIAPPNYQSFDRVLEAFLSEAKTAGVGFVLLSTLYGTEQRPQSIFAKAENLLEKSGIPHAIIRPNFIFQNFINYDLQAVRNGAIFLPTGESTTAYIDVRDVARAAAAILLHPEQHIGRKYSLTGAESLSHADWARLFSEQLARTVVNHAPDNDTYMATLRSYNLPEAVVNFMGGLYAGIAAGAYADVTDHFRILTGQAPRSAREFIEEHKEIFLNEQPEPAQD